MNLTLTYDRDSNITGVTDGVNLSSGGNRNFDVKYSMDNVNRVTRAEEGTYSGGGAGSISNRSRNEQWTLDQVENRARTKLDLNGNGAFNDSRELDDTRTHNEANELLTREMDSTASAN